MFPNFFSVWLSSMCPWREQPTTDAAEILPVKVFLIINAGPPYWQNSRLPVDGHHISLTHSLPWIILKEHAHTHIHTNTCLYTNAHMEEAWNPQWTDLPNKIWPLYMHTHIHNMLTNDAMHPVKSPGRLQYLSCRQTQGDTVLMQECTHTNPRTDVSVHSHTLPCSLCMLSDTLHTHAHTSPETQWIPEHTQAICSISSIQCIPSSCQQAVSVFSCQANSPTSSQ